MGKGIVDIAVRVGIGRGLQGAFVRFWRREKKGEGGRNEEVVFWGLVEGGLVEGGWWREAVGGRLWEAVRGIEIKGRERRILVERD